MSTTVFIVLTLVLTVAAIAALVVGVRLTMTRRELEMIAAARSSTGTDLRRRR